MGDTTPSLMLPYADWPYSQILTRFGLGISLGLLIGLERERRGKEAGLRTFGFIALLGTLGGALGEMFALMVLALTGVLVVLLNLQALRVDQRNELTTAAALLITAMAGILCGQGHTTAPAAVMVLATALLAWKERLTGISMGLTESELRSVLLLAILAIVIYPALPEGAVDPWQLIKPRAAWVTVILIAGIGFINYVLWKMYGARGTEISGFFGGLINSNFTVIELSTRVREVGAGFSPSAYRGILLATAAMLARNAALLLMLAPLVLAEVAPVFALMLLASALLVAWSYRSRAQRNGLAAAAIELQLPFSLPQALKYGVIFLALHVLGAITQRQFGDLGFYFVSALGGLMSSASAVAAAASLATQGAIAPDVAGRGAVLASLTSIVFSLAFALRSRQAALVAGLAKAMLLVSAAGGLGVLLSQRLQAWAAP